MTNPSLDQPRESEIVVRGGTAQSARAVGLAANDAHAHNSFEAPRAVEPREEAVALRGAAIVHRFPPASVTKLEITLA
ncbi:MAG TPA: alpha-L-arabinofuranosidase C-terminal domain-containing protein [Bryobacteraceae bacterium]|nr:alpha-L-arabinofuranosidase C-terminal domain-containing protein [Bryobacteraceae bacterium]